MKIAWVLSESLQLPPKYTNQQLHDVAPIWASWKLWRAYQPDHCVCGDINQAQYCIDHDYHRYTNLYIPDVLDIKLPNVNKFGSQGATGLVNINDVIALHLAAVGHDLILVLGFDQDHNSLKHVIRQFSDVQWVYVTTDLNSNPQWNYTNFTCDLLDNVLQSLL